MENIHKETMEKLENKAIKASKKCPPGTSSETLAFKRFARALNNYKNMGNKIKAEVDSRFTRFSDRDFYPTWLDGSKVCEIINNYPPIKVNGVERHLAYI